MVKQGARAKLMKGNRAEPKFYVKKRTKAGIYITIAEGDTRKEVIDNLKRDSETYRERGYRDGKKKAN